MAVMFCATGFLGNTLDREHGLHFRFVPIHNLLAQVIQTDALASQSAGLGYIVYAVVYTDRKLYLPV